MNLKEFVAESLKEIIDGVIDAQKHGEQTGAMVNSDLVKYSNDRWGQSESNEVLYPPAMPVEFDVAVTINENKDIKGGMGIMVAGFIGYQAQKENARSEVSHIKFSIPVVLPVQRTKPK